MRRIHRLFVLATLVAIAPVIAGCSNFDPDKLDIFHLSDKKKLPGKRIPLFPNGVPGVTQGIPPEYTKGYQERQAQQIQQADAALAQPGAAGTNSGSNAAAGTPQRTAAATPVETRPKAKPKPRHVRHKAKAKAKPKPKPKKTAEPATPPVHRVAQPQQGATAPWPSTPPQQGATAPWPTTAAPPKDSPWPSAPPPGNFSK